MQNSEWWRGAVIYQIYPLSFKDGNGDGKGDLAGIVQELDYVASLGVDAVWIAPFFRSPMHDFGYDVAAHCEVDPTFGTLEDFDRLVERAHALGIKVMIDQVWGHTSDAHTWFQESRAVRTGKKSDWYVWADARPDGTPPNNWLSVFGGSAWKWDPRRRQYYLHHFLATQPTLNLSNPAVLDALEEAARFWLRRGVDGLRIDAVDFLRHDPMLRDNPAAPPRATTPAKLFGLQQHCYDMLHPEVNHVLGRLRALADAHPGIALLGEVSSQDGAFARIARYTAAGKGLHMAYTLRPLRNDTFEHAIGEALEEVEAAGGDGWLCWAFSNHDVERVASRWNPRREDGLPPPRQFLRMLFALLLGLRGSVCLYQGEELGLEEAQLDISELRDPFGIAYFPEFRGRDGCRTPMPWRSDAPHAGFTTGTPWLPIPREHFAACVADQEADPCSLLNAWRGAIAWRKAHPALRYGSLTRLAVGLPLLGFERSFGRDRVVLLLNTSGESVRIHLAQFGAARPRLAAAARVDGDDALLAPYGFLLAPVEAPDAVLRDEVCGAR